jgi:hypothetical protein
VAALRQIGFSSTQVAALGLTTNCVATLRQRAQRDGTAGLVRPRASPRTVIEKTGRIQPVVATPWRRGSCDADAGSSAAG